MKRIMLTTFVVLMIIICLPFSASAKVITSASSANASDYTNNPALIRKLTDIFEGNIALYSDSSCSNKVAAPLGNTSACYPGVDRYAGKSGYKVMGQSCWVYANAVYYKLFGDLPFNGGTQFLSNSRVYKTSFTASYSSFISNGIPQRPGTYVRTSSHSYIILGYNSEYIYYIDANYDGAGKVGLHILGWSGLPSICKNIQYYTTPNDNYFNSLYGSSTYYELDVNFMYNGQEITDTADMVSFDIQMGSERYYDCHDFWMKDIQAGTSYQINSLSGKNGYQVTGYSGNLNGTINENTVIWIYLEDAPSTYELDVNFIYNGQEITETADMVSFDIQMGSEAYYGCHDFWRTDVPAGTSYQISSLLGKNGYQVTGYSGSLSGTIYSNTVIWIYLEDAPTTYNLDVYVIYNDRVSQELATYDLRVGDTTYYQISNYSETGVAPGTYYEISNVKNKYVGHYVTSYGPVSGYLNNDVDIIIEMVDCPHPDWNEEILETSGCTWQKYRKTCVLCGYYSVEQRGDLNHTWVDVPYVGAGCTTEGHTAMSYCSTCGFTVGGEVIPAKGHTPVTDVAVAATCTAAGKTEGSHCSVCGKILTAQTTIPATDHTVVNDPAVAATCTTEGKTAGSHCSVCGTVLTAQTETPPTGHTPGEWKVVTEPTTTATGLRERRCTVCQTVIDNEEIPIVVDPDPDIEMPVVQTVTAKKGENVTLKVYVNSNNKANAVRFNYSCDPAVFEYVDATVSLSGLAGSGTMHVRDITKPIDGVIATITFKIKETATDGVYTINAWIPDPEEAIDNNGNEVACKVAIDKVKIVSKVPGDLNNDGKVNLKDSIILDQYLAGWEVSFNKTNADINGDGKVNLKDSILLDQYLAGWASDYIK